MNPSAVTAMHASDLEYFLDNEGLGSRNLRESDKQKLEN
jgi:hypothetical protein